MTDEPEPGRLSDGRCIVCHSPEGVTCADRCWLHEAMSYAFQKGIASSSPTPALDALEAESRKPIDLLHRAVQVFSNALCQDSDDAGLVTAALVIWEEASFREDGASVRSALYAATGDGATPAGSLGLAYLGLQRVRRDVVGQG